MNQDKFFVIEVWGLDCDGKRTRRRDFVDLCARRAGIDECASFSSLTAAKREIAILWPVKAERKVVDPKIVEFRRVRR